MRFNAVAFLEGLFDSSRATMNPGPAPVCSGPVMQAGIRPDDLPEAWRELYEERAAVREFDGGQAREHAEAEALREVLGMMQAAGGLNAT